MLNDDPEIRCVAFDAVGTLIYADPPAAEVYYQTARRHGSALSRAEIEERFKIAFRQSEQADLENAGDWSRADRLVTSELCERARWKTLVDRVLDDADKTDSCFDELFEYFGRPEAWKCFADVAATLLALEQAGYRLSLASNFDGRLEAICEGLAEVRRFRHRAISSRVGYRKPSLHFFRALAKMVDCPVEAILMVGDSEVNDIRGAEKAGCRAMLIQRDSPRRAGQIASLQELPQLLRL